jgi:hypothetical protein
MATPRLGALSVRSKAQMVVDHHYDQDKHGKPLQLLIPGGLVALSCLGLMVTIACRTWLSGTLPQRTGEILILLIAPFYCGGVFLFSYGYELYDLSRALKLTGVIVLITFAVVVIVAVLFAVISDADFSFGGGETRRKRPGVQQ